MATTTDPKDRARDAFADLPTPEKTAFVIEATFSTIGQALRETGQRLADVLTDFDPEEFFRYEPDEAPAPEAAPPPAARAARAKKPAATKTAGGKKTTAKKASGATTTRAKTTKTAGKAKPKPKKGDG